MRYISLFSGIEAASCAWGDIGFTPVAFAEIEAFSCAVLKYHYPDVPNLGDVNNIDWMQYRNKADIVVGGSPCQDFSISGLKAGLQGERGNLTIKFAEICNAIMPDFIVWENVCGVLFMRDNAFGHFLAKLAGGAGELLPARRGWQSAGCVFGEKRILAWRVLDAQYFGIPQRRKRVFLIGCPRERYNPAKILFEWSGLQGDIEKNEQAKQKSTRYINKSVGGASGQIAMNVTQPSFHYNKRVANTVDASHNGTENTIFAFDNIRQFSSITRNKLGTLKSSSYKEAPNILVYPTLKASASGQSRTGGRGAEPDMYVLSESKPRRIMPIEAERLQGFPDNWTNIEYKGKTASDSARYKAIGNSMAVPVMKWIGKRIKEYVGEKTRTSNK